MNTLTNKDKLALQVSLALVAGMFSLIPTAQGAPVVDKKVTAGTVIKNPSTGVTAIQSDPSGNNIINWKDFSIGSGEKVLFDSNDAGTSYTKTNNYLNVVTGAATSYINGEMKGGKNVYLVNPNGVIMGNGADIDVGNLYVSTQKLSNVDALVGTDLSDSATVLGTAAPQAEVVNMGKIQANSVHVEGTNIRFLNTGDVKYKDITNVENINAASDAFNALPTLSSTSNTSAIDPSGVTLKGTGYVHVGYARTAENVTSEYNSEDIVTGKSADELNYCNDTGVDIENYMLVRSADELANIINDLSGNYMLAKDIQLNPSKTYSPLGGDNKAFSGQFDGNFFSVKNINIPRTAYAQYGGLFGRTEGARIENVKVVDTNIYTRNSTTNNNKIHGAGGIAGYAEDTTFINVANVVSSDATSTQGRVLNDVGINTGDPASAVGGLVGWAVGSTSINSSYNEATVISGNGLVGEIKSEVDNSASESKAPEIHNSYNIGKIWNRRNVGEKTYYGLYGGTAEVENITNSYNAGIYLDTYGNQIDSNGIGPSGGTYCYDSNTTSTSASDYTGIFSASDNGVNDTWRIYEGHSLPLLRSFLKANGNGTVSVSYGLGLYTAANSDTSVINNAITDFDADNVVYNGYYVGAMDVTGDSSRGLSAADLGYNASDASKVKNAGESVSLFYSTDQNGYDIPEATIKIVERNLAPEAGKVHITKVYDGDENAEEALKKALTMSSNAIDVKDIYNNGGTVNGIHYEAGTLIETGLVKVGNTADEIGLDVGDTSNPKVTATYDSGSDVITNDSITVNFLDPDNMLIASENTGHETDYANYKFDTSGFTDGSISVTGDITKRSVKVGLHKSTGLTKYYDKDSKVIKKESDWWTGDAITANVYQDNTEKNTGLLGDDGVDFSYDDPYYADSTTGDAVVNAGTGYDAVYKFTLTGGAKASNYELQDLEGNALTATDGKYTLTGTGDIEKRSLSADNFVFYKKTPENEIIISNGDNTEYGRKVYDYTSSFDDANGVTFSITNVITKTQAQQNPLDNEGVIASDVNPLKDSLQLINAFFSDDRGDNEVKTVAAEHITYNVGATAGSVWDNYTLNGSSLDDDQTYGIVRKGAIEQRTITLGMHNNSGIDKVYDGDATVEDTNNIKGYLGFYGTAADNAHDTGYVTYGDNTSYKLVADDADRTLNDEVGWEISATYKTTSGGAAVTTDAQDVYLVDGTPAAKDIDYTVKLTGENAINYKLVYGANEADANDGVNMLNSATGTIEQLEVTPTFAHITKQYDGTVYVLPTAVTFSDGTEGTLTPAKVDGTTAESQISVTLSGVLDDDVGKVYVETDTTKNSDFNAQFTSPNVNDANIVTYSGLKLASTTGSTKGNNYKIASTGSSEGNHITALALTEDNLKVSYGPISKVYDATKVLNNAESFVTGFGVSGVVGSGTGIPARDISATTATYKDINRDGKDDHLVTFSHKISAGTGGNYTFTTSENLIANDDGTYTFKDTTDGKITQRNVTATPVKNLTKTYDALTAYTDGNRNAYKDDDGDVEGWRVVTLSDGTEGNIIFARDHTKNISTAEYDTANAEPGKTVTYTPTLKTSDLTNYNIVDENGQAITDSNPLTDDSGIINKRDLTLVFNPLTKTYDNSESLNDENVAAIGITLDAGINGAAVLGAVADDGDGTQAALDVTKLDTDYAYGLLNGSEFTIDKNAGTKVIQYNGIDEDVLGGAINNYNLYYKIGTDDKVAIANGTGYGAGTIGKKNLTDADIITTFKNVTKVYDAESGVGYTHNRSDGYDLKDENGNPIDSVTVAANSFIDSITIDGVNVTYIADTEADNYESGYSINSATYGNGITDATFSASANAGEQGDDAASKSAVFKFRIGSDWTQNLSFDNVSSFDKSTNTLTRYTTKDNGRATITPKTIYASLTEQYTAPTKVYDSTDNVTQGSNQTSTGTLISANALHDYVDVSGLMGSDSYTVSAAYNRANVADKDATLGNTVNYTVELSAPGNYSLYTKNAEGVIVDANGDETTATNKVVRGAGEITPKELTFKAGYTEKVFDDSATVNVTGAANVPDYELTGFVDSEELTLKAADVVGTYVVKATDDDGNFLYHDKDGNPVYDYVYNDANGNPVAYYKLDKHVGEVDADGNQTSEYRAVQYANLNQALANADVSGNTVASNYVISQAEVKADSTSAGAPNANHVGEAATYFDAEAGMAVYGSDLQNGKITKRTIDAITPTFYDIEREYNAKHYVGDSIDDDKAREYFKLEGTALGMEGTVSVDYDLREAVFADPTGTPIDIDDSNAQRVDGYDPTKTYKDVDDIGFKAVYKISGLSMETQRDFELGNLSSDDYVGYFASTNTTNNITPRTISGKVVKEATQNAKTYDGTSTAKASNAYFNIDDDDLSVLRNDFGLAADADVSQYLTFEADYAKLSDTTYEKNSDANLSPDGKKIDNEEKVVVYTIKWADNQEAAYKNNYVFDGKNGGWTDGTETEYVGEGDGIKQRIVFVQDQGGSALEKEYDGTDEMNLQPGISLEGRFKDKAAVDTKEEHSGIIAKDKAAGLKLNDVSVDNVHYASNNPLYEAKDVERDDSGEIVNKAVTFTGFSLSDDDLAKNYYLKADEIIAPVAINDSSIGTVETKVSATGEADALKITEKTGGLIKPKVISISALTEKTYDATRDAAAKDLAAVMDSVTAAESTGPADTAVISRHFDSVNQTLTLSTRLGGGNEVTDTIIVKVDGTHYDNTDYGYDDKNVNLGANGRPDNNKVVKYNVSWDNGNYDLVGQEGDNFAVAGYQKNDNEVSRTGVLTDNQGKINPLELEIQSISATKTYDGGTGFSYGTDTTPATNNITISYGTDAVRIDGVRIDANEVLKTDAEAKLKEAGEVADDRSINKAKNDLLNITVTGGTYGFAKENSTGQEEEKSDAAMDEASDSFTHSMEFTGISIDSTANPNYVLKGDAGSGIDFSGDSATGIIERAPITAHGSSASITSGGKMPAFSGTLTGFGEEDYAWDEVVPVLDVMGNETGDTQIIHHEGTLDDYWNEFYKDKFHWGPTDSVTNKRVGTHDVYGWYRKNYPKLDQTTGDQLVDEDTGEPLYSYYQLNTTDNLGKNYVLRNYVDDTKTVLGDGQDPGKFTVRKAYVPGPIPTPAPAPSAPESAPEPVVITDIGYVEKPTVPDDKVYQSVSKDESPNHNHESSIAVQYGENGVGAVDDEGSNSTSGTIAIEMAEVVNLVGGDVASDGEISIITGDNGGSLSVDSTEEGYLSVGAADAEGRIGVENTSDGWDGEAVIALDDSRPVQLDNLHDDNNENDEEDEAERKGKTSRKSEAAITYGDVA